MATIDYRYVIYVYDNAEVYASGFFCTSEEDLRQRVAELYPAAHLLEIMPERSAWLDVVERVAMFRTLEA